MDDRRFDHLSRIVGASSSRRAAIVAIAVAAAGGAAEDAAGRRRRRCRPACPPGQTCIDRACTCDDGGTACGAACCAAGQECQGGRCVTPPPPCVAFGQACKNAGAPCCEGLVCGSGQGGERDVACYVPAGGPCATTADCVFGATCPMGTCIAIPPAPSCTPTFPATGSAEANGAALRQALQAADLSRPVEIVLAAGEYAMPNWGWQHASPLTVRACPGASVTLTPNANFDPDMPFFEMISAQATFEGIAVVRTGTQVSTGFWSEGTSLTLRQCTVRGFRSGVRAKISTALEIDGGDFLGNELSIYFDADDPSTPLTCTGSPRAGDCCIPDALTAACGCATNC